MAAITGLVVPGNQQHFGAKVVAHISSLYCRWSNQKKCYKHIALEFEIYCTIKLNQMALYSLEQDRSVGSKTFDLPSSTFDILLNQELSEEKCSLMVATKFK